MYQLNCVGIGQNNKPGILYSLVNWPEPVILLRYIHYVIAGTVGRNVYLCIRYNIVIIIIASSDISITSCDISITSSHVMVICDWFP